MAFIGARRRVSGAVACALLVGAVAGCGGGGQPAVVPPLGPIPVISATGQITRPIDAYLSTPDQVQTLLKAMDTLEARCMRPFGLKPPPDQSNGLMQMPQVLRAASPLYGFFNTTTPASLGYDRVQQSPAPAGSGGSGGPSVRQSDAEVEAVNAVLHGMDAHGKAVTQYKGRSVPSGGCQAPALAAVGGLQNLTPLPSSLPNGGPQVPVSDPRLVTADAHWSDCMKNKGFAYPTPDAAYSDPRWVPTGNSRSAFADFVHTPQEIATMTADMSCKKATDLMGVAVAVQDANDKAYIASHGSELAEYRSRLQGYLRMAANLT